MKKRIILLLLALTLLCGCGADRQKKADTVSFYYPRASILYGAEDGVIAAEEQDVAPNVRPLEWLLEDYLSGPDTADFRSPFPEGTALLELRQEKKHLTVTLSDAFFALEGFDLTLACASLARTCFSLTGTTELTLRSADGEQRITLDTDSFVFFDDGDTIDMTIGTEPAA